MIKKKYIVKIIACVLVAIAAASLLMACNDKNETKKGIVEFEYYINKVKEFEAENEVISSTGKSIDCVFIGDSWTDFYRPLGDYYPEISVLNRGIGGDNSYGLLQRLDVSVYRVKPKVVVMLIGGNNIDSCREDIEEIIKDIRANLPETQIIMQSMYTVTSDYIQTKQIVSLCDYFRSLCDKYDLTYVDIYSALLDADGKAIDAYHVEDGVHISELGYEKITEVLKPVVLAAVNS